MKPDVQHITNGFQVEHRLHGLLLLVLSYCSLDKQHWEACAHQLKPILQAGKHIRQNQLAVRDFLAIASFTSRSSAGAQVVLDSCIVQHVLANVHAHEHPVPRMRARLLTTLCTISYSIGTATLLGSKPINPSASTYFADTAASAALAWSLPAQQRFAQELLQYDLAELAEAPVMDAVKELYPQDVQYIQFLCWHPSLAPLCDWLTAVPLAELLSSERAIACSYTAVDLLAVALCQNSTLRIQLLTTSSQPHGTQAGAAPGNAPPARAANTAAGAAAVTAYPPNGTSPLLEALLAHGLINHLRSCAAKRSSQTRAPAVELACALALSYRCRFRAALVADHFEHAGLGSAPGAASSSLNPSTADSAAGVGSTPVTNGHQPGGNGGSGCLSLQQRLDRLWLPLEPATAMTGAAAGSAAPAEGLLLGPSVTTERRPLLRVLLESSNMGSLLQVCVLVFLYYCIGVLVSLYGVNLSLILPRHT